MKRSTGQEEKREDKEAGRMKIKEKKEKIIKIEGETDEESLRIKIKEHAHKQKKKYTKCKKSFFASSVSISSTLFSSLGSPLGYEEVNKRKRTEESKITA